MPASLSLSLKLSPDITWSTLTTGIYNLIFFFLWELEAITLSLNIFFFTAHNARHPLGQHPVLYGEASPTTSTELAVAHISHPHTQKEMSKGVNPHITEFTVNYSKRITGELNHVGSQTLSPQEKHTPCQHQRLDVMLSPKITRSRQLFVVFAPPAPFVQLYI